ncbi:MarR family winged helix-turn-helix transcriptional regulator [Actinomadura chibensis]|uniref:Winged helix-turn-helix transcriptional regulator n=1 Tax=Actinomadura chibensis TaxID=392828 RepID=A0A5D0N4V5_9ACTN|nr:MarR family winged helix-turn-helix transcriptional regulator [Actinomadura chibensis]TYB39387.1 winged helix-turn-helix transcriptional regulator [Actinomadura chibensis]
MENLGIGGLAAPGPMEEWPIGRLFAIASRLSGPVVWRIIERHGISPAGYFLLRELIAEDGLRAGEIAKRMLVTPATVTSVVDTLERNGHVRRERSYRDRRGVMLRITDSGRRLVAEKSGPIGRDLGRLYSVVDEGDEAAVRRFLLNLIKQFENFSTAEDDSDGPEAKGDGA